MLTDIVRSCEFCELSEVQDTWRERGWSPHPENLVQHHNKRLSQQMTGDRGGTAMKGKVSLALKNISERSTWCSWMAQDTLLCTLFVLTVHFYSYNSTSDIDQGCSNVSQPWVASKRRRRDTGTPQTELSDDDQKVRPQETKENRAQHGSKQNKINRNQTKIYWYSITRNTT